MLKRHNINDIAYFIKQLADDYPALPGYLIIPILYHMNNIHQPIFIYEYIKDYTTAIIWFPQQCESSKFPASHTILPVEYI
jgi:hypothetical protein